MLSGRHLDNLRAEPGQFFRWRFLTPGTWLSAHPFSLSAPPRPDRLRRQHLAILVGLALLGISLVLQLRTTRYTPWVYWLTVIAVSVLGTMSADSLNKHAHPSARRLLRRLAR